MEKLKLYGNIDRSKSVELKTTDSEIQRKIKAFTEKTNKIGVQPDIIEKNEIKNNNKNDKEDDNIKQWRSSENYLMIQNSFPIARDTTSNIKFVHITKNITDDEINKIKLGYRTTISKCNTAIKIVHYQMAEIANIEKEKCNHKKTKDILKYLYKKDPFLFSNYIPTQNTKPPAENTFEKYYHEHNDYFTFVNEYTGSIYSNIQWYEGKDIGYKEILRIANDLKQRGFMESRTDKNGQQIKNLYWMIENKIKKIHTPMETENTSIISYFSNNHDITEPKKEEELLIDITEEKKKIIYII